MLVTFEMTDEAFTVDVRGTAMAVDLARFTPKVLGALFTYGLSQKLGDAGSGAKAAVTDGMAKADAAAFAESDGGKEQIVDAALGMALKALDALYEGKWTVRGGNGTVKVSANPAQAMAMRTAKDVLFGKLQEATGAKKLIDIADHPKSGGYLVADKNAKVTWDDDKVLAWMAKVIGKRNFLAEAVVALGVAGEEEMGL